MVKDFLRHLFPRVVLRENLRLSYTFCLGGLAFTAFLALPYFCFFPSFSFSSIKA